MLTFKQKVGSDIMATNQRRVLSINTAKAIKAIRYRCGLTQNALAGTVGVSVSAVKTWERGYNLPTAPNVKLIIDSLDRLAADKIIPVAEAQSLTENLTSSINQDVRTAALLRT